VDYAEICDGRDYPTKMELKGCFAFAPDPAAVNLPEQRRDGQMDHIAETLNRHVRMLTVFV
jgi:hypothetical protein